MFQNFSEELVDLPDTDLKILISNRALVFMQSRNSNTIVEQIRRREGETGRVVAYHVGLNDDALKHHVELSASLFKTLVDKVEALGMPVCRIFAEDDFQMSLKHVLDFEIHLVKLS